LKPLLEKLTAAADIRPREQYLLLNYSTSLNAPQQAQDMMSYVRDTFGEANRTSRLKVGLAIIYTPKEQLAEAADDFFPTAIGVIDAHDGSWTGSAQSSPTVATAGPG
jgi:hypothetical protein